MRETATPEASGRFTLVEHLEELRLRIFIAGGAWLAAALGALIVVRPILEFLLAPARTAVGADFAVFRPAEIIMVYLKTSLAVGALAAAPVMFGQAWSFIRPALSADRRPRWPLWGLAAAALFAGGAVFAYRIALPVALGFLMTLTRPVAAPVLGLDFTLSFALAVLLLGGVVFEIPVAMGLLTRMGLVTPGRLRRGRRVAAFVMVAVAAVLTPTTDILNLAVFALPMLALYEVGIGVSAWLAHRRAQRDPLGGVYDDAGE